MSVNYIKCSKCNREFHSCAIRTCPHEAVQKRYGKDICYNCCMRCKHHYQGYRGLGCRLVDEINGWESDEVTYRWENGRLIIERVESDER